MFASNSKTEMTPLAFGWKLARRSHSGEISRGRWEMESAVPYAEDGHPASIAGGTAYVIFAESKHLKEGFHG